MAGDTNPAAGPSGTNINTFYCSHCGLYYPTRNSLIRHYEQLYAQANQSAAYKNNVNNSVQAENRKDKANPNAQEKAKIDPTNLNTNPYSHETGIDLSQKTPTAKVQTPYLQKITVTSKFQAHNQTENELKKIGMVEFGTNKELLQILSKDNPIQQYRGTASVNNSQFTNISPSMTVKTSTLHKDMEIRQDKIVLYQKNQQENAEQQLLATTFLLCKICQKFFVGKEEAFAHNRNEHPQISNCLLEAQVPKPLINAQSQPKDTRDINYNKRKNMRCLACQKVFALSETSDHQMSKHPELRHCLLFENCEADKLEITDNQHTVEVKNQHVDHQKHPDDTELRTKESNKFETNKIELETYETRKRKKNKKDDSESSNFSSDSREDCSKAKIRKHRKYGRKDSDRQRHKDRSKSESLLLRYKNKDTAKINENKDYSVIYNKQNERNTRSSSDTESGSVSTHESNDETARFESRLKRKSNFVKKKKSHIKRYAFGSKEDKNGNGIHKSDDDTSSEDSSDSDSRNDLNLKKFLLGFRKTSNFRKHLKLLLTQIKNKKAKKKTKTYKLYKCICDLHFLSEEKLYEHLKIGNHEIKSKSCKICKREFTRKILRTHVKIHHKKLKLGKNDFKIITVESLHLSETDSDSDSCEETPKLNHEGNLPSEELEKSDTFKSQDKLTQNKKYDFSENELEYNKKDDAKVTAQLFKCVICDVHFLNESTFRQHLQKQVHDIKTKRQCQLCDLYFTQISLKKHKREHHQKKCSLANFQIIDNTEFCEKEQKALPKILLKRPPYLNVTEKNNNKVNLFKCESCNVHFLHEVTWKQHLQNKQHCVRTKTQCENCLLFFSKKTLIKHIEWHHEKKKLIMQDFNIINSSDFPHYCLQQQSEETSWKDSPCHSSSNEKSDPRIGKVSGKRLFKAKLYKCDLCDVLFLNENVFKQHFRQTQEHAVQYKTKCKYCQFNFSRRTLKVHIIKHHRNKNLQRDDFEIMKSSDLPKSYFGRHDNNSTQVDYTSKTANDVSSSLKTLDIFRKDNTNLDHKSYSNVLYKCEHCQLCFLTRNSLDSHLYNNDHEKKNIVKCSICQYYFSNNSIPRHLKVHHEALKLHREDFDIVALFVGRTKVKRKSKINAKKDLSHRSIHYGLQKDINSQLSTDELSKTRCNQDSTRKNYLKLITNKLFKCSICNIYFVLKRTLIMHMNVGKHKQFQKMVTCRICQYTFSLITFSRHDLIQHKKLGFKREDLVIVDNLREQKSTRAMIKRCSVQLTALQSSLITTTNKSNQQDEEGCLTDELLLTHKNSRLNKEISRNSVIVHSAKTPEASVDNILDTGNGNFANTGVHFLQDMITKEYSHLPDVKNEPVDIEYSSVVNAVTDNEENLFTLSERSFIDELPDQIENASAKTSAFNQVKNISAISNTHGHSNLPKKDLNTVTDLPNSEQNLFKESSRYSLFDRLKECTENIDMETIKKLNSLAYDEKLIDNIFTKKLKSFLANLGDGSIMRKDDCSIMTKDTEEDKLIKNKVILHNCASNQREKNTEGFNTNLISEDEDYAIDSDECIKVKVLYFPFVKKEKNIKDSESINKKNKEIKTDFIKADTKIPETFLETSTTNALSGSIEETNKHYEPLSTGNHAVKNGIEIQSDLGGGSHAWIPNGKTNASCSGELRNESINTEKGEQKSSDTEKTVESSNAIKDYGIQFLFDVSDFNVGTTLISTEIEQLEDNNVNFTKKAIAICENNSTTDIFSKDLSSVKESNHDNNDVTNSKTTIDGIFKTTQGNMVFHSVANKNDNDKDKTSEDAQKNILIERTLTQTVNNKQGRMNNRDEVSNTAVFAVENSKSLENIINPKTAGLFLFEDSRSDVKTNNFGNVFGNIQVTDIKTTSGININKPVNVKQEIVDIDSDNDLILEIPEHLNEVIEISSDEE